MMNLYYQEYLERLQDLHTGIQKELAELPDEALDWIPAEGMNSLSVLVVHLTGAERYWIGDVVMGDPSDRNRAAEFQTSGLDRVRLNQRLEEVFDYAKTSLEDLDLADLERESVSPRDGKRFSAAWALLHALEHTAIHLGHIQLTRQLWSGKS